MPSLVAPESSIYYRAGIARHKSMLATWDPTASWNRVSDGFKVPWSLSEIKHCPKPEGSMWGLYCHTLFLVYVPGVEGVSFYENSSNCMLVICTIFYMNVIHNSFK